MTDTIPAPPQASGDHEVTAQVHSDGHWYATCHTCGWNSGARPSEQHAMVDAGRHHETVESWAAPRKKSAIGKIAGLTVLGLVGIGVIGAAASTGSSSEEPGSRTRRATGGVTVPKTHRVTYRVEGTTDMASITYENANGDTSQQSDVDVPLTRKSDGGQGILLPSMREGDFVYISAQNSRDYGSVTCIIEVDGVEVERNTSHGGYTIATCSGRL